MNLALQLEMLEEGWPVVCYIAALLCISTIVLFLDFSCINIKHFLGVNISYCFFLEMPDNFLRFWQHKLAFYILSLKLSAYSFDLLFFDMAGQ